MTSASAKAAEILLSSIKYTTVCPLEPANLANSAMASSGFILSNSSKRGPPTHTSLPFALAWIPRPLIASKLETDGAFSFFSSAAFWMARAIICSESPSTAAAKTSAWSPSTSFVVLIETMPCSPLVSVPVLSKIITSISRAFSRARRLRTKIPFCAAEVVLIATTRGTANPKACGHAMTKTATTRCKVKRSKPMAIVHAMALTTATPMAR